MSAEPAAPWWRRIPGIYPFEIAAAVGVAAAVLFLRSRGLRIDWSTVTYTIPPMLPVTGPSLLLGIPLMVLYRLARREPLRPYLRGLLTVEWIQLFLRLWLAYMAMVYAYFWLKVCVPLVRSAVYDAALFRLDRAVHLGFSPTVFVTTLFAGTPLVRWIDLWYSWWAYTVFYGIAFVSAFLDARVRRRLILAQVLLWMFGAWTYTAVPAVGPAYTAPELFDAVRADLPRAQATQALLWENYERVRAGRDGTLRQFKPARGVAAMPSLHVGVQWLLLLFLRKEARPLFLPGAIAVGLTFVGAVLTGWHYAIDGYVGIALAQLAYWLASRLERDPAPPAADSPAGAA